ncbi:MAG: hypothetical protein JRK53_09570 [Deltaproteobacteria bacterium]|nr:hypothetical protein [Deltaproteobacteria bacterium]
MSLIEKIDVYLKEQFGPDSRLEAIRHLGEGIHGVAYELTVSQKGRTRRLIMKTLFPSGFGHDHYSDRAQVLLLAHANYNKLDRHVKAIDVVGEAGDRFISLHGVKEFYIFMEEAQGKSYFEADRARARILADYLLVIHKAQYPGENAKVLYRRRIRELLGHGECIMGIIDAYGDVTFVHENELVEYAGKCPASAIPFPL